MQSEYILALVGQWVQMLIFKITFVIFWSICFCFCSEPYRNDRPLKDLKAVNCDLLFHGESFPMPRETEGRGLVKLCQNQVEDKVGYEGPVVLATLYSTVEKIPVYTSNVVMIYPNSSKLSRPEGKYWHRVSQTLCDLDPDSPLPTTPILSNLKSVVDEDHKGCKRYQATAADYLNNNQKIGIDRGHLSPNSINSQDMEKQIATFTLTNAAPQFSEFNRHAWFVYECMVQYVIRKFAPMERIYITTGTLGAAKDESGNDWWMNEDDESKSSVLIPGFYWKVVCYPGNPWTNKPAWSFAILQQNAQNQSLSHSDNFMTVKKFSDKFFTTDIVDKACMKAKSMGPIQQYFDEWDNHIESLCLYKQKRRQRKKQEL